MGITDILSLLGGLALFLYGMQMTSSGLEAAAGAKMKILLERLTANRFMGVLVGAAITAAIQSSSAMTRRRERTARSQSALSVTRPCDSVLSSTISDSNDA